MLRQSFSAGHVLHRERKRDRSLRVLVLLDTSTTSRILTNQSTRPTIVRYPPDAGQRRGKQTCSEARHSVKSTGELLQSDPGEINGFHSPSQVISRKLQLSENEMNQQTNVFDSNGHVLTQSDQSIQDALEQELCTPQRQIGGAVSPTSGSMTISPSLPVVADRRDSAPLQGLLQVPHRGRVGGEDQSGRS